MHTFFLNTGEKRIAALTKNLLASSVAILLTACGSGGGSEESNSTPDDGNTNTVTTTISGTAIKGVVSEGLVNLYSVEEQGGKTIRSVNPMVSPVRTDSNGRYTFNLEQEISQGSVVVEVTADSRTRMKCDTTEGCIDNDGQGVSFGESFNPGSGFSLRSVASGIVAGREYNVHLSPLTHMAAAHAEAKSIGLTADSIQESIAHIEDLLDLDAGAMRLAPADLTAIESYSSITKAELEMGVLSASFLSMVELGRWDTIEEVIEHVEEVIASDGVLGAQSTEGDEQITLDEVFLEASEIALDLEQALPDSEHAETFAAVRQETNDSYNDVAELNETPDLEIISQPQGVIVDELEEVLLSVGATGGELSYQWRRDGVELQGAVLSSLLISAADTSDSGSYDVLVSDESGTLESLTALVVVNELPPVVVIDPVQISTQPTSVSVDEGEGAVLSVAASGGGELVYQWFKGGVAISGATSSSLSFASASVSDSGVYSVSVTNSVGSQTSVNATIQVNEVISIEPVVIASQPQSTAIDEGETAVLSIVATGGGDLSYTWRKDGVEISGANASSLSIEAASVADAGAYDVIVSNSVGQQVSSVANVEINELEVLQSIALEWSIPEERADGTALDLNEIDSYLIRYGTDASNLAQSVVVGSGSDTSAQIDDMVAGTYYFVILTIDIDGVQSEESEIISLTI